MNENFERFVGRKIKDSDGDTLEVIFIDKAVGLTLQEGSTKCCLNGPMSPHGENRDYEELFGVVVKAIDNWFLDLDEVARIWSRGEYNHAQISSDESVPGPSCAVGD